MSFGRPLRLGYTLTNLILCDALVVKPILLNMAAIETTQDIMEDFPNVPALNQVHMTSFARLSALVVLFHLKCIRECGIFICSVVCGDASVR
jgi:hypothetical protein